MWLVKKCWTFTPSKKICVCVCMYEMVDISIKTYENNDIEVKVDGIGTLWLNEKHAEEKGGQKKKN